VRALLSVSIFLAVADLCVSLTIGDTYGENSVWMTPGFSGVTILYSLILLVILQFQLWKAKKSPSQVFEPCTASSPALWAGWILLLGWFGTFLAVLICTLQRKPGIRANSDERKEDRGKLWAQGGLEIALALLGVACMGGIIREGTKALGNTLEHAGAVAKNYELDLAVSSKVCRILLWWIIIDDFGIEERRGPV